MTVPKLYLRKRILSWKNEILKSAFTITLVIIFWAGLISLAVAKEPVRPDLVAELLAKLTPPERYDPRPTCGLPFIENPHENRKIYRAPKPRLSSIKIDMEAVFATSINPHCETHYLRRPPNFPDAFIQGNASGFCKFSYTYSADGRVSGIEILHCTDQRLVGPTIEAVRKWPQLSGACLTDKLVQRHVSTMQYQLVDEDGQILPYP